MHAVKCPRFLLLQIVLLLFVAAPLARAQVIENRGLRVSLDAATAVMQRVQNLLTGETYPLEETSPFSLVVDGRALAPSDFRAASAGGAAPRFTFTGAGLDAVLEFRGVSGQDFIEKILTVRNTGSAPVLIERVTLADFRAKASELEIHPHCDPSVYAWLLNVFVRGAKGGLYAGVENPFGEARRPAGMLRLSFQPRWRLAPGAASKPNVPQRTRRLDQEVLDWGEVWAMQRFVEAVVPPQN